MNTQHVDILCITAHPDDVEISCGGTVLRHVDQGHSVGLVELTAGELRTRGYYLGSNVSYNLKKLVEMGFLDHQRSRVDRRSVRIRLTAQGQEHGSARHQQRPLAAHGEHGVAVTQRAHLRERGADVSGHAHGLVGIRATLHARRREFRAHRE